MWAYCKSEDGLLDAREAELRKGLDQLRMQVLQKQMLTKIWVISKVLCCVSEFKPVSTY